MACRVAGGCRHQSRLEHLDVGEDGLMKRSLTMASPTEVHSTIAVEKARPNHVTHTAEDVTLPATAYVVELRVNRVLQGFGAKVATVGLLCPSFSSPLAIVRPISSNAPGGRLSTSTLPIVASEYFLENLPQSAVLHEAGENPAFSLVMGSSHCPL